MFEYRMRHDREPLRRLHDRPAHQMSEGQFETVWLERRIHRGANTPQFGDVDVTERCGGGEFERGLHVL